MPNTYLFECCVYSTNTRTQYGKSNLLFIQHMQFAWFAVSKRKERKQHTSLCVAVVVCVPLANTIYLNESKLLGK